MQLAAEYTAGKIVRALLDGFDTTLTGKAKKPTFVRVKPLHAQLVAVVCRQKVYGGLW